MAVKKRCPECDALVSAPDSAAGTTVDCRKCGAEVKIPKARRADEEDDARPQARRPAAEKDADERPARPRSDRDNGAAAEAPARSRTRRRSEEDEPARPRKKGTKKGRKGMSPAMILTLVGAGVFALMVAGVVGTAIYFWSSKAAEGKTTINGETWYKVDDPDGQFAAHFPGEKPKYEKFGFQAPAFLAKKAGQNPEDMGWEVKSWILKQDGREYTVMSMKLPSSGDVPPDLAARTVAQTRVTPGPGVKVVVDDVVKYGAHDAKRICTQGGGEGKVALTIGVGRRQMIVVSVYGRQNLDHTDPKVAAFLENFKMLQ